MEARGKTREEVAHKLADRIDTFEKYSTPHSALMAELAARLARKMGLAETDVSAIVEAARLHDIGLYAMAPRYQGSPGPLSFEQRLDLWRHPVVGEQQMAKREASRHAQLLVRWHHEWWNGSGYPDQLAFEDIPIGARVLRAVELYCSLISDRPYRPALDEQLAQSTLEAAAGIECDPYAAAALLELLRELNKAPEIEAVEGVSQTPPPDSAEVSQAPDESPVNSGSELGHTAADPAVIAEASNAARLWSARTTAPLAEAISHPVPRSFPEMLLLRTRSTAARDTHEGQWRGWSAGRGNGKPLLAFEASVLRQIEFRSIALPYWSTARLDWYLKVWDKQIFANDPSAWGSTAARAMVEATVPLTEEQVMRLMEDIYVPRARLSNPDLRRWFTETDAWWMDNLRGNVERLEEETSRSLALLTGMQAGDYALSFDESTRDLRQPLATVFWRLMGRAVTVPGRGSNRSSNLKIEEFIRHSRADLLYLKLPPDPGAHPGTRRRPDWRESWITGGAPVEESRPAPQSRTSYLSSLDRILRLASHFRLWAIGYQETGLATAQDIAELIKEHRPVRAIYSKDLTEVVGGLRNFIIVASG